MRRSSLLGRWFVLTNTLVRLYCYAVVFNSLILLEYWFR